MKRYKRLLLTAMMTTLLMGIFILPAHAQTPSVIMAEVDRTNLSTDELLVLAVTIDATTGGATSPNIPPLNGFEVVSRSSGSQISIINGDMTLSETYTYMLHPMVTGLLTIEPITVTANGYIYSTQPIAIQVSQGTGQVQPRPRSNQGSPSQLFPSIPGFPSFPNIPGFGIPSLPGMPSSPSRGLDVAGPTFSLDPSEAPTKLAGQDLFVEAKVDNLSPYQGEQVIYRLRFFQGVELGDDIEYQGPTFTGLWHEQLPDQMVYSLESGGRTYRVMEIQTVLFPTVVGDVTIDPSVLNIPGDIFTRGYVLESEPIDLAVQPLPAGAPVGYQGAVGDFGIQAEVDINQTIVDEPISLKLTINGAGNLHTLSEPEWDGGTNWRAYDSQSSVQVAFQNGKLSGSRSYERLLVPIQPGSLSIPPIEYHFFDPAQEIYKTVSTGAIDIQVSGIASLTEPIPSATEAETSTSNNSNSIIRPLKAPEEILDRSGNLVQQPIFWLLWALPVALLVGQFGWTQMRKRAPDMATRRSQGAAKTAIKSLRGLAKDPQANTLAGQILLIYLSDKLNQRVAGLTMDELSQLLTDRGFDYKLIGRIQNCLLVSEMGRYAPTGLGSQIEDVVGEVEAVVKALEKGL